MPVRLVREPLLGERDFIKKTIGPWATSLNRKINAFEKSYVNIITLIRSLDWIVFYAVSAIFQPYNGGDY